MSVAVARRSGSYMPAVAGLGSLLVFLLVMEALVQSGMVSRFIVPPPSEILGSFGRLFVEEHVVSRFEQTIVECLTAGVMLTVFGIAGGVLMQRYTLLQRACET